MRCSFAVCSRGADRETSRSGREKTFCESVVVEPMIVEVVVIDAYVAAAVVVAFVSVEGVDDLVRCQTRERRDIVVGVEGCCWY